MDSLEARPGCGQGLLTAASADRRSSQGAEAGLGTAPSVCATPPARTLAGPEPDPGPRKQRIARHSLVGPCQVKLNKPAGPKKD